MVAVFAGFAVGDLVMFQQMGFGLAVAVLIDATLVRTRARAGGDDAARPLELVPAALARVAPARDHRGAGAGAARGAPRRDGVTPADRAEPPLRDGELLLRRGTAADVPAIRTVYSEPDIRHWMGWDGFVR